MDRREELRQLDNLWPLVERALPKLNDLLLALGDLSVSNITMNELREKYLRGEEEHQRDWLDWQEEHFAEAIREEAVDMLLYSAMRLVLLGK